MIASYKRLIDDGHALALTEALALERERSRAANLQVTAEEVEARRLDVVERGRAFG
ncbi:MAG: hypothetical protein ACREB7_02535 [Sphingopyxis sp.]|uniref:hypothetical protein n=1 Tax=Sphingopyxis sp. TaxID=1908224 RepID=UPI003D6CBCF0